MSKRLEFFFDFRSPYSYLAFGQLPGLGADVVLRPMNVLKVMDIVGNVPTTIVCAAKGRYAGADLARWSKRYGLSLRRADMRAIDTEGCLRAVLAARSPQEAAAITEAIFHASWRDANTLASVDQIIAALAASGIETGGLAGRIDDPAILAALAANCKEAGERGIFGAPTIMIGDVMFFGNDRLEFVREHLALEE